jgi:hypothetical protein
MLFKALKYDPSYDWVTIMPQIVNNYNNSKHETTKYAPSQINEENYKDVNNNITKNVTSKRESVKSNLNVGDNVRIQVEETKDKTKWSKEIYKIEKVYIPRKSISKQFYYLEGDTQKKKYYDNDLQLVHDVDNKFDEITKWEISRIIKPGFKNGVPSYYVKWKGYKDHTLESRDKLLDDVPKMIKKLADDEVKFKLAVSLHSASDAIRSRIMPFSANFPLADLRESLEYWYSKKKSKITYEYVVWKGINDNKESVDALVKFCKYVPCKVNLIEYNPIDDGEFQQASEESINAYIKALAAIDIVAKVRRSRGKDIDAACGQLANKEV